MPKQKEGTKHHVVTLEIRCADCGLLFSSTYRRSADLTVDQSTKRWGEWLLSRAESHRIACGVPAAEVVLR